MAINNMNEEKLVDYDNNSSSSGNESVGVKPRRSARLLNKANASAAEKIKSPLKRGNDVEGSSRNSRQKMSEAVAVEYTDNTENAEISGSTGSNESVRSTETTQAAGTTQNAGTTQTTGATRTTGTNATPSATTSPMPSAPQTTQSNRRSTSISPPLFSISIGFGPIPPSFASPASSAHIISSGSQQDLPPEIQQMIQNMTGGMRNGGGSSHPAASTTTTFRSMGDGIGIGIAGISIPITVLNGTGATPTNSDFLELARQMSQMISRFRSSTPTSEDFANISDELEPLLNDFFSRIFGGPASSAPAGLSSECIAQLPETSGKSEIDCSICREVGRVGEEKCVELPCKHSFHFECIEPWLKRVASCPICRKVIE